MADSPPKFIFFFHIILLYFLCVTVADPVWTPQGGCHFFCFFWGAG